MVEGDSLVPGPTEDCYEGMAMKETRCAPIFVDVGW